MSSVLNPSKLPGLSTALATETAAASVSANEAYFEAYRPDGDEQRPVWPYWLLGAIVVGLHGAAIWAYHNRDISVPPKLLPHKVEIAFIKPEVEPPPPPPEPPKPPPPPPKVKHVAPPPPQPPVQQLHTAPAEHDIAPNDLTVAENTQAPKSSGPVAAAPEPQPPAPVAAPPAPPAPPAPKVEEPVTEATANAAYLNNPKPEYPPAALRQGWGGTVVLKVRVLADGHAESVEIKKSSGRKVLDEAAAAVVRKWTFVPSKRGSTPIDGWATVPIVFNPEQ